MEEHLRFLDEIESGKGSRRIERERGGRHMNDNGNCRTRGSGNVDNEGARASNRSEEIVAREVSKLFNTSSEFLLEEEGEKTKSINIPVIQGGVESLETGMLIDSGSQIRKPT